jgi:hypothetical protein
MYKITVYKWEFKLTGLIVSVYIEFNPFHATHEIPCLEALALAYYLST